MTSTGRPYSRCSPAAPAAGSRCPSRRLPSGGSTWSPGGCARGGAARRSARRMPRPRRARAGACGRGPPGPGSALRLACRPGDPGPRATLDAGAAELRRIERDLHDGAQARLVAMGLTLDAAGRLIGTDPAAARALLYEARDASARALTELRDLVRGIHPPVLADRGLADAVRALALDSPLRVHVTGSLRGRPPAPVESAAYFPVSQLLRNVA